jgi:16S rRNA G966 N2-methylase RsmD
MLMTNDYKYLKTYTEGIYSLSHKEDADKLSSLIKDKYGDVKIMDATSGIGGNSISFGKNFSDVVSVEINPERYEFLCNNIKEYKITNCVTINDDSTQLINKIIGDLDAIYVDPPWGGSSYKTKPLLKLNFGNITLEQFILNCFNSEESKNLKIMLIKIPTNYDLMYLYKILKNLDIHLYKLKKLNIIVLEKKKIMIN